MDAFSQAWEEPLPKPKPFSLKPLPNPYAQIEPVLEEVMMALKALEPPEPETYIRWPFDWPKDELRLDYEHNYKESVRKWNLFQK